MRPTPKQVKPRAATPDCHRAEANVDVRAVEMLPGDARLGTTAQDTPVVTGTLHDTVSPFEMVSKLQDRTPPRSPQEATPRAHCPKPLPICDGIIARIASLCATQMDIREPV